MTRNIETPAESAFAAKEDALRLLMGFGLHIHPNIMEQFAAEALAIALERGERHAAWIGAHGRIVNGELPVLERRP